MTHRTSLPPWLVLAIAAAVLRLPFAAWTPLTPEEAYHWTFAKRLDWSYLDHPPMIAWSIALGTAVFGDVPLGVRAVPLLFSTGTALLLARLAAGLFGPRAAFPAVLLFGLLPVPFVVSGAGFPDSPLLFFWALAMGLGWKAFRDGRPVSWIAAGAALGAAMLSKYTAVFLAASLLAFGLASREGRRRLASPWPWLGVLVAAAVFSPVLAWNASHDWASLRYQSVGRLSQANDFSPLSPFKFLAQQAGGVLGLTAPLAAATLRGARRDRRPEARFLVACFAPLFGFFLLVSLGRSNHLLWPVPAFLPIVVLMAGAVAEARERMAAAYARHAPRLLVAGALALLLGGVHASGFLPGVSPFHGLYGWGRVAARARELRAGLGDGAFYVGLGRKYTVPSQLAFQLGSPDAVHGKNVIGLLGLQFDYWADLETLRGRDAVVVLDPKNRAEEYLARLRNRFEAVEDAGTIEMAVGRSTLLKLPPLRFSFYIARGYRPNPEGRLP